MSAVDKVSQFVRFPIESARSEEVDPVIAPAEPAVEIVNRHQLDDRDAEICQFGQFLGRRPPRPGGSERADVHLIDYLAVNPHSLPVSISPTEGGGVDDLRRPFRTFRLIARGGIRKERFSSIEPKGIPGPDCRSGTSR